MDWIDKRLRGIAIRQDLTDEWKTRGIQEQKDFAILTNEISKATFGKTVGEYKRFKGLERDRQNLRDHMTDWDLKNARILLLKAVQLQRIQGKSLRKKREKA